MILLERQYAEFEHLQNRIKDTYTIDFEYDINYGKNGKSNYYFIFHAKKDIEICYWIEGNHIRIQVQKPHNMYMSLSYDNRSIHARNKAFNKILSCLTILTDAQYMKV